MVGTLQTVQQWQKMMLKHSKMQFKYQVLDQMRDGSSGKILIRVYSKKDAIDLIKHLNKTAKPDFEVFCYEKFIKD